MDVINTVFIKLSLNFNLQSKIRHLKIINYLFIQVVVLDFVIMFYYLEENITNHFIFSPKYIIEYHFDYLEFYQPNMIKEKILNIYLLQEIVN